MNFRTAFSLFIIFFNCYQQAFAQGTFMTTRDFILKAEATERAEKSPPGGADKKDLEKMRHLTFFTQGVADGLTASSELCMPIGTSPKQIVTMTKKLAYEIPQAWDQPAAVFIRFALLDQWKCSEKDSKIQ